jgi:hypothetical protein
MRRKDGQAGRDVKCPTRPSLARSRLVYNRPTMPTDKPAREQDLPFDVPSGE